MNEIAVERSLQGLLDAVAARTTAPGGGVVAGVVAALAGALGGMCARFTDGDQDSLVLRADELRARAAFLAQSDPAIYADYVRLRRSGPAGDVAAALDETIRLPLEMAEVAAELAGLALGLARSGNPNLRGDAAGQVLADECRTSSRCRSAHEHSHGGVSTEVGVARAGQTQGEPSELGSHLCHLEREPDGLVEGCSDVVVTSRPSQPHVVRVDGRVGLCEERGPGPQLVGPQDDAVLVTVSEPRAHPAEGTRERGNDPCHDTPTGSRRPCRHGVEQPLQRPLHGNLIHEADPTTQPAGCRWGATSSDRDLDVHALVLVAGHGAPQLVGPLLQGDGERAGLPGPEGWRCLRVDTGTLDGQVVRERALVLDREGVVPRGEARLVEGDRELLLDHADVRAHGGDRGGCRGPGTAGRRGVRAAVRARTAAGAKQKHQRGRGHEASSKGARGGAVRDGVHRGAPIRCLSPYTSRAACRFTSTIGVGRSLDRTQAEHFASTARSCGVSRIAYLGGLPVMVTPHWVGLVTPVPNSIARPLAGRGSVAVATTHGADWLGSSSSSTPMTRAGPCSSSGRCSTPADWPGTSTGRHPPLPRCRLQWHAAQ